MNLALPGILDTGRPFRIILLGTANDFAIPEDLGEAAHFIATGFRCRIDIGEVNGKPFYNVARVGFGVGLTRIDPRREAATRLIQLYRCRLTRAPSSSVVPSDGHDRRYRPSLKNTAPGVGTGHHYGGGMTLSEEAAIDDNKLDVSRLEVSCVIAALKLLPSLRAGTQGRWSEVSRSLAKRYLLKQPTRSINADGKSHRRRHISGWTRGAEVAVNGFEYQN